MQNELVGAVKSHATILIEHLKRYGITIKRTQALEVISNLQAQTDWNRVRARLCDDPIQQKSAEPSLPLGLDRIQTCAVVARPRSGKTEVLKTIACLESADRSALPVFICLSGGGHINDGNYDQRIPAFSRWCIHYDSNGIVNIEKPTGGFNLGVMINFQSRVRGDRSGLKEAFLEFFKLHSARLSEYRIGSVLIDEFSRLSPSDEIEVLEAAARFCLELTPSARRLIIACQVPLQNREIRGVDLSYVTEIDYPGHFPGQIPTAVAPSNSYEDFPPDWDSESISDHRIVVDILAQVRHAIFWRRNDGSSRSRLHHVRGDSLWFRDFRNSLANEL